MRYQRLFRFRFLALAVFLFANGTLSGFQTTAMAQDRDQAIQDRFHHHRQLNHDPRSIRPPVRLPVTIQRFRTIDGSWNNVVKTGWGKPGNHLTRLAPPDYADGLGTPAGESRRSPREISNLIFDQEFSNPNRRDMSSMVWQWGQFLDHDIDLTEAADPPEYWPIQVPFGDIFFDPFESGGEAIPFNRSAYGPTTGVTKPRQQVNFITAWIDGSNIYGSDDLTSAGLRTFEGGLLKTSVGRLLPIGDDGFFMAGDIRANEQVCLTAMHTLFLREHNRLAREIAARKPQYNDEQVFLRARRKVISVIQSITVNEFLPAMMGPRSLPPYREYRPQISPKIRNSFSTAAYRLGHSMLPSELLRMDYNGQELAGGTLSLSDAFFNPSWIQIDGIEPYLLGLTLQASEELDTQIVDDVRNFLFGMPGSGGFDLVSLNIQRGRDHGLPDYNTLRVAAGIPAARDFSDITKNEGRQEQLRTAYDFDINNIDGWVGMLAEDHVPGGSVGPTIHAMMQMQFAALRDSDRFWYQTNLRGDALQEVENTTLSMVIRRNTSIDSLAPNVFFLPASR